MKRPHKILSIVAGVLLVAVVAAVLGLVAYSHSAAFRAKVQAAASRGMGMQVSLDGPLHIGLFPSPNITLESLRVQNRGVDAGSVDQAYLRFRLWPLLHKDVELETVSLTRPRVLIRKGTDGVLDLLRSTPPVHIRPHGPIEVIATDGVVRYEDAKSGAWVEARGCDAKVHGVHTEAPDGRRALERLSFSGADMTCKTVAASKFTGTDLKVSAVAPGKGVYALEPITLQAFGSEATGSFHADLTGGQDSYAADLKVVGVQVARILQDSGIRPFAAGRVDLAGNITSQGRSHQELLQGVQGKVTFHGSDVTLQGYDIDKELTRFERTQRFDLADLLGLFVLDGAGLLATKGYDYATLISKRRGGVSHIHEAVADLDVSKGVVSAQDVAMSTDTHRIAAQGKLDIPTEDFDHVNLGLVDAKGCVIAEVDVSGSIRKPKLQKPGIVKTLAGPARSIAHKGEDLFTKKGCPVFYDGSVKPY